MNETQFSRRGFLKASGVVAGFGCVGLSAGILQEARAEESKKLSALIVDGINNHDWPRTTEYLSTILQGSGLFAVDVSTTPPKDAAAADWDRWRPSFGDYDVVLSNFNGGHKADGVRWPDDVQRAFEQYVSGGRGVVIVHAANNSFLNWEAYNRMIGLGWRSQDFGPGLHVDDSGQVVRVPKGQGDKPGHGPSHDFTMTVFDRRHPITAGVPDRWMHPDEQLSHGQHGPAEQMTVLSYAYSKDSKKNEPMEWVIPFGRGRVYTTLLGHLWTGSANANFRCVGFQTMLIRGTEWAASGKVSYPIPDDFPTAQSMSLADNLPVDVATPRK